MTSHKHKHSRQQRLPPAQDQPRLLPLVQQHWDQ
jgi:hypothetical protein